MRILFTYIGGVGHFWPLVPVARAAEAAGHTVAIAGSGKQVETVRRAGFAAIGTSDPHPDGVDPHVGVRDTAPLEPTDREAAEVEFATNFAGKGARRHASALREVIADWEPDVMVRDEADLGSVIAAEVAGVPCASVVVLAAGTLIRQDLVAPVLDEVRSEHGLPADPSLSALERGPVLTPFPPSLRHPDRPLPAGALAFRLGEPLPPRAPGGRPRVYFTLGTIFNQGSGDLFERVLAGLAEVDADIVVTVGARLDPAAFGPQPDHIRIESFVDQATLLPDCDLVVSHGGSGSLGGTLAHGLPTVLLPLGADQPHNAERIEALGAGLVLDAATVTPGEVAAAVTGVLADESMRAAAQRLQAEINALPGAEATVSLLEACAAR